MNDGCVLSMHNFITGTCNDMCSESERCFRQNERLLHPLEYSKREKTKYPMTDAGKTIKRYSRPAAGQKPPKPSDIRTPKALTNTINYMMKEVVSRKDVDWTVIYGFVFDRLRAVRQDMVMQSLNAFTCISMLEVIVRFHIYAGYRLCEEPISRYDPTINKTHLLECLNRLLVLYEEEDSTIFKNRSEMEALNLIENLGVPNILHRAFGFPKVLRTPIVDLALEMSYAFWLGNYRRACRIIPKLPPLLASSASLHLPEIRRHALGVMSKAYSSNNGTFPLEKLREILLFETEESVVKECTMYDLSCRCKESNAVVIFNKSSFNSVKRPSTPKHMTTVDAGLESCNLDCLLLGD